jgi:hypothetical protein
MKVPFQRIVSVDWSGGEEKTDAEQVSLRVAVWEEGNSRIEPPPDARFGRRKWTRLECRERLRQCLADDKRSLILLDFGFGWPWGSDKAIFQVQGWRQMLAKLATLYSKHKTARETAIAVNALPKLAGHGPFRLGKADRTTRQFYLDHGISYFRLTEAAIPQAISQWYLGKGHTVGYHTITGMATLHWLMLERKAGRASFQVWPQETCDPHGNVIAESYPAICPQPTSWGSTRGQDERDAWKVLQCFVAENDGGEITSRFCLSELPFGRVKGVSFVKQIRFEGFIFGVM